MFLVDSNVLLDVIKKDPCWCQWSEEALSQAADSGPLAINQLIYAEVSVAYQRCEQIDGILSTFDVAKLSLPWEAAFLAGKAFIDNIHIFIRAGEAESRHLPSLTFTSALMPRSEISCS
jgi:hypothetical protein